MLDKMAVMIVKIDKLARLIPSLRYNSKKSNAYEHLE